MTHSTTQVCDHLLESSSFSRLVLRFSFS